MDRKILPYHWGAESNLLPLVDRVVRVGCDRHLQPFAVVRAKLLSTTTTTTTTTTTSDEEICLCDAGFAMGMAPLL